MAPGEDEALAAVMRTQSTSIVVSRARFTEDRLESELGVGGPSPGQYVILGAGFDTFAFRRQDLADRLQVFELDHPDAQAMKRSRLDEIGWRVVGTSR